MSTINRDAFIPQVTVIKPSAATPTTPATAQPTAELTLKVKDVLLRNQDSNFNGLEHGFALIPTEKNGEVSWKRVELDWQGQTIAGYYDRELVDVHQAKVSEADAQAIARYGAAFGVETNDGVVWAQAPDQNTKPKP